MNRREALQGLVAGSVLGSLLPSAANALVMNIRNAKVYTLSHEALNSPHFPLVKDYIERVTKDGVVYCRGEGWAFNYGVQMNKPHFLIEADEPIWNCIDGNKDEPGLSVTYFENGIEIDKFGLASTHGSSILEREPYYVRGPWLPYERKLELDELLPPKTIDYDMRWLEQVKAKS